MITGKRNRYVASHVTADVQAALRAEAIKQRMSISRLIYTLLARTLRALKHDIKELK